MKLKSKTLPKRAIDTYTLITNILNFNPSKDTSFSIKNDTILFKDIPKKTHNNNFLIYKAASTCFFPQSILRLSKFVGLFSVAYLSYKFFKPLIPNDKIRASLNLTTFGLVFYFLMFKSQIKLNKIVKSIVLRNDLKTLEISFFMNRPKIVNYDRVYMNVHILKMINPNFKGKVIYWRIEDIDYMLPIDNFEITDHNVFFSVLHGYKIDLI